MAETRTRRCFAVLSFSQAAKDPLWIRALTSVRQLTEKDRARLAAVEAGLALTADVSRADLLLFLPPARGPGAGGAAYGPGVGRVALPRRRDRFGCEPDVQPLVLRVLQGGRGGRLERVVKDSRAPVVQDVLPVHNDKGAVIGALAIEFNMFAYERHRRRSRIFQDAQRTLLHMCARGEIAARTG